MSTDSDGPSRPSVYDTRPETTLDALPASRNPPMSGGTEPSRGA
nr:hypothetical protein [Micromonospora sagamiensis]